MGDICLVSGGLDSYLAWWATKAQPVFVDFGQQYASEEMQAVHNLYDDLQIVQIKGLPTQQQRYIPCRNLMFGCLACMWHCDNIYIAGMDDDQDLDKSPAEFKRMSRVLSRYAGRKVEVSSPWWGYSKSTAVAKYLSDRGDASLLKKTFSCYHNVKCHECDACYRWAIALLSNNIEVRAPSEACIITHGIEQLWHRPGERFKELCLAMDFANINYKIFNVKDTLNQKDQINDAFLCGDIVILLTSSKSEYVTLLADQLRVNGYLFHGIVPNN